MKKLKRNLKEEMMFVKITESKLCFFLSFSHFYFSIFRTLGLGLEVICHTVTSVTSDGVITTLITELKEKEVEGSGKSDIIQHG